MSVHILASATRPAALPAQSCPHCGAPMAEVVTSVKYATRGLVCTGNWNAPYARDQYLCGAPRAPRSLAEAA